jgi:hypothetical protein
VTHPVDTRVTNIMPVDDIPADTPGTITEYHAMFGWYGVRFDGHHQALAMEPHEIEVIQ